MASMAVLAHIKFKCFISIRKRTYIPSRYSNPKTYLFYNIRSLFINNHIKLSRVYNPRKVEYRKFSLNYCIIFIVHAISMLGNCWLIHYITSNNHSHIGNRQYFFRNTKTWSAYENIQSAMTHKRLANHTTFEMQFHRTKHAFPSNVQPLHLIFLSFSNRTFPRSNTVEKKTIVANRLRSKNSRSQVIRGKWRTDAHRFSSICVRSGSCCRACA